MNHAATAIEGDLVRFERLLPGPIERVWDYLTKPNCKSVGWPNRPRNSMP